MQKRNHKSLLSARTELNNAGFVIEHSSPSRPECWRRPGDSKKKRFAIAREDRARSSVWHIITYPGLPVVELTDNEFDWLGAAA